MFQHIPSLQHIVIMILSFLVALTVHEYAHARSALAAGDETAKRAGRVSLNPLDHLDPIGTIMFLFTMLNGFGIAWGKPVPVNPYYFKNPRWDNLKVSLWGPASNIITAIVLGLVYRVVAPSLPSNYALLLQTMILFNLMIALFNLIPVPPLDGSHILSSLLPIETARKYDEWTGRYGMIMILALLLTGAVGIVIGPPVYFLFHLITGVSIY